jgi:hypothetical protein
MQMMQPFDIRHIASAVFLAHLDVLCGPQTQALCYWRGDDDAVVWGGWDQLVGEQDSVVIHLQGGGEEWTEIGREVGD